MKTQRISSATIISVLAVTGIMLLASFMHNSKMTPEKNDVFMKNMSETSSPHSVLSNLLSNFSLLTDLFGDSSSSSNTTNTTFTSSSSPSSSSSSSGNGPEVWLQRFQEFTQSAYNTISDTITSSTTNETSDYFTFSGSPHKKKGKRRHRPKNNGNNGNYNNNQVNSNTDDDISKMSGKNDQTTNNENENVDTYTNVYIENGDNIMIDIELYHSISGEKYTGTKSLQRIHQLTTPKPLSKFDLKPSSIKQKSAPKHKLFSLHVLSHSKKMSSTMKVPEYLPYPPLVPYHQQAEQIVHPPAYVPTLTSVSQIHNISQKYIPHLKPYISPQLPNMTLQYSNHEQNNLKLHLCNDEFEAYSASYLTTKEHILGIDSESYNLSWVNCEMASFTHMRHSESFYKNPNAQGMIMQALDVLDFSVIHLSAYERTHKKYQNYLWSNDKDRRTKWRLIDDVKKTGQILEDKNNPKKSHRKLVYSEEAKKTVVVMPFLGGAMGSGHSEVGNRFIYLYACFWSFYEFFPNIVAGVNRPEDVIWAKNHSGLPFYDVLLLENLPKSAALPLATVRAVKQKLRSNDWPFEYVFFTESDQILMTRNLNMYYQHLSLYPRRMLLPHRLMPYSYRSLQDIHKRTEIVSIQESEWMRQSCCMPRQNCLERKSWENIKSTNVPIINYYGLYVALGNSNFLREDYRACTLSDYRPDYCP